MGENLWIVITRAGAALLDRLITALQLPLVPDLAEVQLMALTLVVVQELVYVLALHALAFWIFPGCVHRFQLLHRRCTPVALDPL